MMRRRRIQKTKRNQKRRSQINLKNFAKFRLKKIPTPAIQKKKLRNQNPKHKNLQKAIF